jgi:hypothetical protein
MTRELLGPPGDTDCLVGGVYTSTDFTKRHLPADPGIETRLGADGQAVADWRVTASGWVLGLALTWDGDHFREPLYGGARPPAGLPGEPASRWASRSTHRPSGPNPSGVLSRGPTVARVIPPPVTQSAADRDWCHK